MIHTESRNEPRCLRMDAAVQALRAAMLERVRRRPRRGTSEDDEADPFEVAELRALSCACPRCIVCREA